MYYNNEVPDEQKKTYEALCSRIRHLEYAAEDYDRKRGKGAFAKKFKVEDALLQSLMEKKIKMAADMAMTAKPKLSEPKSETSVGVPVA